MRLCSDQSQLDFTQEAKYYNVVERFQHLSSFSLLGFVEVCNLGEISRCSLERKKGHTTQISALFV